MLYAAADSRYALEDKDMQTRYLVKKKEFV